MFPIVCYYAQQISSYTCKSNQIALEFVWILAGRLRQADWPDCSGELNRRVQFDEGYVMPKQFGVPYASLRVTKYVLRLNRSCLGVGIVRRRQEVSVAKANFQLHSVGKGIICL